MAAMLEPLGGTGRRRARGFTLIELVVVIAIAAVLVAVAVPSFREFFDSKRVEGVATELYTDLQYARSEAVSRRADVRVEFASTGYEVWLMKRLDKTEKDVRLKAAGSKAQESSDWGGASLAEAPAFVAFEPVRGIATTSGNIVVGSSAGNARLQVSLNTVGRMELCVPSGFAVAGYKSC